MNAKVGSHEYRSLDNEAPILHVRLHGVNNDKGQTGGF